MDEFALKTTDHSLFQLVLSPNFMKSKLCLISLLFSATVLAESQKYEYRIEVTGQAPRYYQTLSKILPQQQLLDENSFSSDNLATLLDQSPSINLNGQGGLFQSFNIRGFARWRIQSFVEGIPIYSERRAGASIEFLPPSFVGQAYLIQGAASTQLGSGAIGGGIDLSILRPNNHKVKLGYGVVQDYRDLLIQGKNQNKDVSWILNQRHANNSQDGDGKAVQDRFEHNSLALRKQFGEGSIREGLFYYSQANNIAKASAEDPEERFTRYPSNKHLLGKVVFDYYNTTFYVHKQRLLTQVDRPGQRLNNLINESLDLGVNLSDDIQYRDWLVNWRMGVDARTGVKVQEQELDALGVETLDQFTLNAQQWDPYIATDFSRDTSSGSWIGGARLAYQYQKDDITGHSESDVNLSGFIGYAYDVLPSWTISGYLSSAYRVPSLTERFFNGSTPRGQIRGSKTLRTERAYNAEAALTYKTGNTSASVSLFHQQIDNYIERLVVNQELREYRNLDSAEISGVSYQAQQEFDWHRFHWRFNVAGQWLNGRDKFGLPIADITPPEHRISVTLFGDSGHGFVTFRHRQSSDELVSGELPTDSVNTLDAGYIYQLTDSMQVSINLTNITDRIYVTSRDDLAPNAKGRDVNISLSYSL